MKISLALSALWLAAASAHGATPRSYVSVSGSDANVCSNSTTPCRTFVGAVAQTSYGGQVVVLDSGTYDGGTITQAVTIHAPAGVAALVETPIVVDAPNQIVTLQGLTFASPTPGVGTAITINHGWALNIENCVLRGWNIGLYFNIIARLSVLDSTIRDNRTGIYLGPTPGPVRASIAHTRLLDNSLYGLFISSNAARVTVREVLATGNHYALYATSNSSTPAELHVSASILSNNYGGVLATTNVGYGKVRIWDSSVTNNVYGLTAQAPGVILSRVDNTIEGNGTDTVGTIGTFVSK
jgi:hypothetical protein